MLAHFHRCRPRRHRQSTIFQQNEMWTKRKDDEEWTTEKIVVNFSNWNFLFSKGDKKKLKLFPFYFSFLPPSSTPAEMKPTTKQHRNQNEKDYFAESINSNVGFYGRRCESYLGFVFGWCNSHKPNPRLQSNITAVWSQVKMGEDCRKK